MRFINQHMGNASVLIPFLSFFQIHVDVTVLVSIHNISSRGPMADVGFLQIRLINQKHGKWHLTTEKSEKSSSI